MDLRIIIKLLGGLLSLLSLTLLVPGIYGMTHHEAAGSNLIMSAIGCSLFGALAYLSQKNYRKELNHRTGIALVGLAWIGTAIIGAIPFYLSDPSIHFLDALFESTSGFTGTGASILTDLESTPRSILLWRSMTQWIGGMGIVLFFIAILPIFGLGGVQLFRAETPGPSKDKITPRVRDTAKMLWGLYLGLTLLLTFLLYIAGMSPFDAVNHAMTTTSTGGFSTKSTGIAHFNNPLIEDILIVFMLLCSINFSLHFRLFLSGSVSALFSTEAKWYFTIVGIMVSIFTLTLWRSDGAVIESFRDAAFTVICTASSTGFTNVNYESWPAGLHFLLILLMVMGGMSGSTAGGLKCIRIVTAIKQLLKELKRVVHPRGLYAIKINQHAVSDDVINAIWGFIFLYITVLIGVSSILCFQGLDLVSATTASISALSNIGPALGELGPYDNYSALPFLSKGALVAGMLLGRLEFYTIIVLFTVEYWRK
jgi:trk system potassium uptake protein TrkH